MSQEPPSKAPPRWSPAGYWWRHTKGTSLGRNLGIGGGALIALVAIIAIGASAANRPGSSAKSTPAAVVPSSPSWPIPSHSSPSPSGPVCIADPHAHVYSPDRLELLAACVEVSGTIEEESAQEDGDYHVRLRLDPGQTCSGQPCLNGRNLSQLEGDLLLEPVCENPVTREDAVAACQGYHNPLVLPLVGSHVAAVGPFVLDIDHGWNEIHPLESITVVPVPPSAPPVVLTVTITAAAYGYVAATTAPGASCTATARLPSGETSGASALQATVVAGQDGAVAWSYGTVSTTKSGTGTHTVTCTLNGTTASASAPFTVP